jgi:hypothetical protein
LAGLRREVLSLIGKAPYLLSVIFQLNRRAERQFLSICTDPHRTFVEALGIAKRAITQISQAETAQARKAEGKGQHARSVEMISKAQLAPIPDRHLVLSRSSFTTFLRDSQFACSPLLAISRNRVDSA